ncbi:MAG TPA: tRNA (guanosine(37)-N1)-methyltransferase TrmD, partial [Firmicutes bacterium]|nr:tRNA (guanosine(37)-N1)-methyltransferase TrmD [Bacillota bacterium]
KNKKKKNFCRDVLLEYPQYTRPPEYRGMAVPEVLLSGDHGRIAKWRREQSIRRTMALRPDLVSRAVLSREDEELIASLKKK